MKCVIRLAIRSWLKQECRDDNERIEEMRKAWRREGICLKNRSELTCMELASISIDVEDSDWACV
jgi:lysyl-tRNA synthetase class II